MSGRARRVLVYTATLLIAPLPLMPFERGMREFVWAVLACGVILSAGSFYAARGEWRVKPRMLVGTKLLAASAITYLFGVGLVAWSLVWLMRS
ncbi:MAG TPA: hypothetical protein VFS10_00875 [Pyrinomonadaceae bacterium]|nr:hypothetical protein [Pyrinomonadaceae bacterium]